MKVMEHARDRPPPAAPAREKASARKSVATAWGATMKCEWVQENILLHIYNELPDDARYELEQHVARCTDCAAELKAARQFHATLSQFPVEEPSPNLVTASRMRLQEGSETTEQGGFWQRLMFDPGAWLRPIKLAPALAAAIFIVGFAGGIGATYQVMNGRNPVDLSCSGRSHRIFHHRHPVHLATTWLIPDQHPVQHGFHAGSARLVQRSAHPAVAAVRHPEQLQLRRADGFGGPADADAERYPGARGAVCMPCAMTRIPACG